MLLLIVVVSTESDFGLIITLWFLSILVIIKIFLTIRLSWFFRFLNLRLVISNALIDFLQFLHHLLLLSYKSIQRSLTRDLQSFQSQFFRMSYSIIKKFPPDLWIFRQDCFQFVLLNQVKTTILSAYCISISFSVSEQLCMTKIFALSVEMEVIAIFSP
jgi:hypothetical protein